MNITKRLFAALACVAALLPGAAGAATVGYSFSQLVNFAGTPGGSAPWLDLVISDTATAGTVSVTITANLTGVQTLTGLWLSTSAAGTLTSGLTTANGTGSGESPQAFAAYNAAPSNTQSGVSGSQNLNPIPVAQGGSYNILFRFQNNASAAFQGTETRTFDLIGGASSGLTAQSFVMLAGQTSGGQPSPRPYALASFTNFGGTGGSGVGYVASVSPVPEPGTLALMLAGAGILALRLRRAAV